MSTTSTKDFPSATFVVERAVPTQYGSGIVAPPPRTPWTLGNRHTPRQPTQGEILAYLAQPGVALITYASGASVVFLPNGRMVYGDDAPAAVLAAMRADGAAPDAPIAPTSTPPSPAPALANDAARPAPVTRPWECARCHRDIPKRQGRAPKVCDTCLTPHERETREARRNAKTTAKSPNETTELNELNELNHTNVEGVL